MTITRRSTLAGIAGAGLILPFTARAEGTLEATKKRGTFRVGVTQAPPWFSKNPKTGEWVEFPLPDSESDPRRIEIDPTNPNRIWWSGNLAARMGFVEVLSGN